GAHRSEALGYLSGLPLGDDPLATFRANADEQIAAFSGPGAMERIVEHPMGDLPGSKVIQFRIGDLTLHTWDLARAIGGDEELPQPLVAAVWAEMEPLRDNIAMLGLFGEGPSGEVPDDAPLQTRLLDLVGRRP
ncbi:MAG: TIGR03086 family metal-binding protein, partial [Microthrixaceae bacterium]